MHFLNKKILLPDDWLKIQNNILDFDSLDNAIFNNPKKASYYNYSYMSDKFLSADQTSATLKFDWLSFTIFQQEKYQTLFVDIFNDIKKKYDVVLKKYRDNLSYDDLLNEINERYKEIELLIILNDEEKT